MRDAARDANITLLLVSGYRSYRYQGGLIRRKLDAGQALEEILLVNAPPGCSAWLCDHADRYGFSMTYPRDNPLGFIYEPWHWSLKPPRR